MKNSRSEQWATFESVAIGTTIVLCNIAVVLLPFLIPRDFLTSWPMIAKSYDALGTVFPYLTRSLPLSNDPDFYVVSKLVLFSVGTLCVLIVSFVPLSRYVTVREHRVIDEASHPLWWFWLLFVIPGYWVLFNTYKPNESLSWASRAAVESPLGIAAGNFVQFGLFALITAYVILIKHYLRLRYVWENGHGRN